MSLFNLSLGVLFVSMMAKEAVEILAGVVIGTVKMLTPKSMALLRGLQTQEAKKKNGDF